MILIYVMGNLHYTARKLWVSTAQMFHFDGQCNKIIHIRMLPGLARSLGQCI